MNAATNMLRQAWSELAAQPRTGGTVSAEAPRVWEALGRRTARSSDRISVDSGVPIGRGRAVLGELELSGLAERRDSGWCQAKPEVRS
jgi:DNA processing protein